MVDGPDRNRWASLLTTGAEAVGALPLVAVAARRRRPEPSSSRPPSRAASRPERPRPAERPSVLRRRRHGHRAGADVRGREIWCRVDAGPHGFLSIAAHAHADALAIEVRVDGVDVLADPGTYCYHGEPAWRAYFRSTAGHDTLELDGRDQSESGGPFLWTRHANTWLLETVGLDGTPVARWVAEHDGYSRRDEPVRHRRHVELDREASRLTISMN